jgi:hypothetical protein
MAHPALAGRHVTVEQLRQFLAEQRTANRSDSDTAGKIASMELSERLTDGTLDQLVGEFKSGPKTTQALDLLADLSAFLEAPAGEVSVDAPPSMEAQRTMVGGALQFVATTLSHLPDFLATRSTRSFDDAPMVVTHGGFAPNADLHLVGVFSRDIAYRDGREVTDAPADAHAKPAPVPAGLNSWGEFGPILAIILSDSAKGKMTWSHWEQTATGRVAVFHYSVPKESSHYAVNFCCMGSVSTMTRARVPIDTTPNAFHGNPGYHGALYLDPTSGAVLRLTTVAELQSSPPITRADIAVQYRPVEIGGNSYICPVKSVAISSDRDQNRMGGSSGNTEALRLNEVGFTNYHRFGATVRILPAP